MMIVNMSVFVSGLLVTASRHGGKSYPYNTTTVVLLTELAKLILSLAFFVKE